MPLSPKPAMSSPGRPLTPSRAKRTKGFVAVEPAAGSAQQPGSAAKPRPRERGVYSDVRNAEMDLASVNLGRAADGGVTVPALDFDATRAEYEPDLARSTAGRVEEYPETAINPKVQVAYAPQPGHTPREIVVRRKRRLYQSQSINELLRQRGIDYALGTRPSSTAAGGVDEAEFALERFDSEDYEVRTPAGWLELGRVDGDMRGLPGVGMRISDPAKEVGEWVQCRVVAYDDDNDEGGGGLWTVEWPDSRGAKLPRVHLLFIAEDPVNFADRVAAAHAARTHALEQLRYNLYVDCMPTEDMPQWDTEQSNRVLAQVLNTSEMKRTSHDTAALFQEVNACFLRTLNKMALDGRLAQLDTPAAALAAAATDGSQPAAAVADAAPVPAAAGFVGKPDLCKPMLQGIVAASAAAPPPPPPRTGTLQIPEHNFAESFSNVCFYSLLTKPEVIRAMKGLRWECNKVLDMRLFKTTIVKAVTYSEFEQTQEQATNNCSKYLRETWCGNVKNTLEHELRDSGKGWFNLAESDYQVYNLSKLKALFCYCDLMMKDSLRFEIESSVREYTEFIEGACACEIDVRAANDVGVEWTSSRGAALFQLELVSSGEGDDREFAFSTSVADIRSLCVRLFDAAFTGTQKLDRIDRLVLHRKEQRNFWGSAQPCIDSVSPVEDWVVECRERIERALGSMEGPMDEFLAAFEKHVPFLRTDVEFYLAEVEWKHAGGPKPKKANAEDDDGSGSDEDDIEDDESALDAPALLNLYHRHNKLRDELKDAFPTAVRAGLCDVDCTALRNELVKKHDEIATLVRALLADKVNHQAQKINEIFEGIEKQLSTEPKDIEQLVDLKEYMDTVPARVTELQMQIEQSCDNFDLLDGLKHQLEPAEFHARWTMFAWPKTTADKMIDVADMLEEEKKDYAKEMEGEQEAFEEKLKDIEGEVAGLFSFSDMKKVAQVHPKIMQLQKDINESTQQAKLFNTREGLFEKDITEYSQVGRIARNFEPYFNLWQGVQSWNDWYQGWMDAPLLTLDAEKIEKDAGTVSRMLNKAARFFERNNDDMKGQLTGCKDMAEEMSTKVDDFRPHIPMCISMCHPGMRERHWEQISAKIGKKVTPTKDSYTLSEAFEDKLEEHEAAIVKIGEVAIKEFNIETALDKMEEEWSDVNLELKAYRDTGTSVLGGFDDYMALLDEHITMTQAMQFSAFKGPFEERIDIWNETLMTISEVLDEWIQVQRNWLYLQPIFDSEDINKQLPVEGKRFSTVDKIWRTTMTQATAKPLAVKFCYNKKLLGKFQESNKLLELVQKGLADYLETKRAAFSRFYFLSNDELLEILSETKDPTKVQGHLGKCFEGINRVDFEEDLTISAMNSADKEKIHFIENINPVNREVEKWMTELNEQMVASVRDQMWQGICDYPVAARTEWMIKWPAQVVINGSQVFWTKETEQYIDNHGNEGVKEYFDVCCGQIKDMVMLIRGGLNKAGRTKVGALAVIDVHARDTMQKMYDNGVDSVQHFDWISQMRFYWRPHTQTNVEEDGDLRVVMVRSDRPYGYEYLGNSMRLVITPLTDKCYLTLMGALQMILGGAPAGPAGTGKTETTKDLAKALAKQCVVFNCSDGLDYLAMGKFFKG
eukprot:g5910.t1